MGICRVRVRDAASDGYKPGTLARHPQGNDAKSGAACHTIVKSKDSVFTVIREAALILEGTWEYTLEGKLPVVLKAGDVLFIPAGVNHLARNVGSGNGAELVTYIVEKGKPLVVLAK